MQDPAARIVKKHAKFLVFKFW